MTFILSPLTQSCAFKYTFLRRSYNASHQSSSARLLLEFLFLAWLNSFITTTGSHDAPILIVGVPFPFRTFWFLLWPWPRSLVLIISQASHLVGG
jgi:hypothetical protein